MKTVTVAWWIYSGKLDAYDYHYQDVQAKTNKEAITIIKNENPRGKCFEILNK